MNYRTLGRTGLSVSEVGFGAAPIGIANYLEAWDPSAKNEHETAIRALHHALDVGINYWDTAPGYGDGASERIIGEALVGRRDRVVLATKVGEPWTYENVLASAEVSLRRFGTDRIDVLQFHGGMYTAQMAEQVLGGGMDAMLRLRDEGKVGFIGLTSEGPTGALERVVATGRFDTLQIRYNVCYQHPCDYVSARAGIMYRAEEQGMGIITMRTLTSGLFQKTMRAAFGDATAGLDLDAFCLNYVLSNPLVDVALVGMRRPEEADRNAAISDAAARRFDLAALHHRFVS